MLNIIFIILATALFVYISQKKIIWGASLIIFLLPSYLWRIKIFGLPSTFLEIMILSLFVLWFIQKKPYQKIFWQQDFNLNKKWSGLLLAWFFVSLLAWYFNATWQALGLWRAYFLEPILFFIILLSSLKNNQDQKLIIKSLAALIFYLVIFAIVQNFTGTNLPLAYDWPNVKRLTSIFSYPNALALLSAPIATFLLAYYFFSKSKQWEYLVISLFGIFLSWWSVSEGALLAMMVAWSAYGLFFIYQHWVNKRPQNKYIFFSAVVVLLFGFFISPVGSSLSQQFFHPNLNSLQASSLEIRSNQWQETWQLLKDNWFAGAGLGAYQNKMFFYHQVVWLEIFLYPHNIFLNFWSELGALGLLVFLLMMFFIIKELLFLLKNKNELAWPLTVFWLVWLVHGLVDVPYFKNDLSVLFFIFLALTLSARRLKLDLH